MDLTEALVQKAFDSRKIIECTLEMLRKRIDPILSVWARLNHLLVLVVLQSDVELEALLFMEACLHHRVSRHLQDVRLV